MTGGGIRYDQSSGAERVGNAEFARSKEDSRARSGTKNSWPHGCDRKKGVTRVSSKETNRVRNRVKHPPNPQARRPRAAQGKGGAVKDVTSESEDDEMEGVKWGSCMYG